MTDDPGPLRDPWTVEMPKSSDGFRVIVAGIDRSTSAVHAASFAAGLARRTQARLLLVHVRHHPIVWPDAAAAANQQVTAALLPAPELVALASSLICELGLDVEIIIRLGSAAREIAHVATERRADLVVTGTSRSWLRHPMSSVPTRLARRRAWPVIAVP